MTLSATQIDDLKSYLTDSKNKHGNLHSRKEFQRNGRKELLFLNALKRHENGHIVGYACGPSVEIEYDIYANGTISYRKSNLTTQDTLDMIDKIEQSINSTVRSGFSQFNPQYMKGKFYLRRHKGGAHTKRADEAVNQNVLTQNFVDTIERWDLKIYNNS